LKFQVRRHGEVASTSPPFSFSNDIAPSADEYTKPDSSTRLYSRGHPVELCAATPTVGRFVFHLTVKN
jgi:hypothetical protein